MAPRRTSMPVDSNKAATLPDMQAQNAMNPLPIGVLPSISTLGLPPTHVERTKLSRQAHPSFLPRVSRSADKQATPSLLPRQKIAHPTHAPQAPVASRPPRVNGLSGRRVGPSPLHAQEVTHPTSASEVPMPEIQAAFIDAKDSMIKLHRLHHQGAALLVRSHPEYTALENERARLQVALTNYNTQQIQLQAQHNQLRARHIQLQARAIQLGDENNMLKLEGSRIVQARLADLEKYQRQVELVSRAREVIDLTGAEAGPTLLQRMQHLEESKVELQSKVEELRVKLEDEVTARRHAEEALAASMPIKNEAGG